MARARRYRRGRDPPARERGHARRAPRAALLATSRLGPSGARVGAFFDYDGTIIAGFSAGAFYRHRLLTRDLGPRELARTLWAAARGIAAEEDFAAFLNMSLAAWADLPEEEMRELSERLFKHQLAGRLHHEIWRIAQTHAAMGHTLVVASSATRFQ